MQADKRWLTTQELLWWTYRDQKAHRILRKPADWFLWALDDQGLAMRAADRRQVHRDAAEVHKIVMALPDGMGATLAEYAAEAHIPQRCTPGARLLPVEPSNRHGDYSWARRPDGTRFDYTLLTAETISLQEPVYERTGRKRMRQVGTKNISVEVKYCPIEAVPSQACADMMNSIADEYDLALTLVRRGIGHATLTRHYVLDLDLGQTRQNDLGAWVPGWVAQVPPKNLAKI